MHFIGMDIHKNYSSVAVTNEQGQVPCAPDTKISQERGAPHLPAEYQASDQCMHPDEDLATLHCRPSA